MHRAKHRIDSYLFILQAYIIGGIFYVFRSGLPQPADLVILVGIGLGALSFFMRDYKLTHLAIVGITFAGYTFLVNLINYVFFKDPEFFLSGMYYIFNVCIFLFVVFVADKERTASVKAIYTAILIAIALEFALFVIAPGSGIRSIGTFNNPNQFSYWVLLAFCILIAVRYPNKFKLVDYAAVITLTLLVAAGLSKAALLSFSLVLASLIFTRLIGSTAKIMFIFALACTTIFIIFDFSGFSERLFSLQQAEGIYNRFTVQGGQNDDTLYARGYYRMFEHAEYLLLGAGEGAYWRFSFPHQMHTGVGTIMFSYGLVGASLFGLLLFMIFRKLPLIFWIMLISIMFYGLTHHNVRFSLFWVFLGTCYLAALKSPPTQSNIPRAATQGRP